MSIAGWLKESLSLARATPSRSTTGAVTESWGTATSVYGKIIARSGQVGKTDRGFALDAQFICFLPAGTDVEPDEGGGAWDRVTDASGNTYRVRYVDKKLWRSKYLVAYLRRLT